MGKIKGTHALQKAQSIGTRKGNGEGQENGNRSVALQMWRQVLSRRGKRKRQRLKRCASNALATGP